MTTATTARILGGTIARRSMRLGALSALSLGLMSCCGARPEVAPVPEPAGEGGAAPVVEAEGPPRLVVAIVIDQLGSWVLERYLPYLDEDGFFRRATTQGRWYQKAVYPYASTFTAPGHATLFTGRVPADHGIVGNSFYDPKKREGFDAVYDPKHPVLGRPKSSASPKHLLVPTVGDTLKKKHPDAKVMSLSIKDRAAVLPGGKEADLALWFNWKIPGFTSSTFYGDALPAWLDQWLDDHPVANLMRPWEPADPALLEEAVGNDESPAEGDFMGLGVSFPHDPRSALKPWSVMRMFPQLTEYTTELAAAVAVGAQLGKDDQVDLLTFSISGLDYTGHSYGPQSWEYLDHLRRADAALAALTKKLDEKHGPVRYLVSADHGVTPNPNRNPEGGGRLYPEAVTELAKKALQDALGHGEWVDRYKRPFVYFSADMPADQKGPATAAVAKALTAHEGVRLAVGLDEARGWRDDADPLRRSIALSISPISPGDLYVCPEEHWIVDEGRPKGFGTTHGTPYRPDREVPVLMWGPGIEPGVIAEEVSLLRVAPTISKLLGVAAPPGVTEPPLEL